MRNPSDDKPRPDRLKPDPASDEELDRQIERLANAGRMLESQGACFGAYFSSIHRSDIATQRHTKDNFAKRLRQSQHHPQVVTVRPRGSRPAAADVLLPLEVVAETLEFLSEQKAFVPITETMRRLHGGIKLPSFEVRRSGWRKRQQPVDFTEPDESS